MSDIDSARVREFVIAGHGSLERVREMLAEQPALLNLAHVWTEGDSETAIQGASHVGNAAIALHLLDQGAPLAIYTAAMLGRADDVERMVAVEPGQIRALGAHGIPLIPHAVFSGDVALVQRLFARGAAEGMSLALSNAVGRGDLDMTRWIVTHGRPDAAWKNFQGKTALDVARERGFTDIAQILREYAGAA
jgi:hypothetical protein